MHDWWHVLLMARFNLHGSKILYLRVRVLDLKGQI